MLSFPEKPLSYNARRSVFSPEERLEQTLKTVDSVRRRISGCQAVVVEMGEETSLMETLRPAVDKILVVGHKRLVRWACDSRHKGLGEAAGLLAAGEQLRDLGDYYFKVSGRYCLDDNFRLEKWAGQGFTVRLYDDAISTRLYGFPAELFGAWRRALWLSLPWLALGRGLEHEMYRHLPKSEMAHIEVLGVSGLVAPDGMPLKE
jgi:hypothetical protein